MNNLAILNDKINISYKMDESLPNYINIYYPDYNIKVILPSGKIVSTDTKNEFIDYFNENPQLQKLKYLLTPKLDHKDKLLFVKMIPIPETA